MAAHQVLIEFTKLLSNSPDFCGTDAEISSGRLQAFLSIVSSTATVCGLPLDHPAPVLAVSTRLSGAAAAWWQTFPVQERPQTFAQFSEAISARFVPTNQHLINRDLAPGTSRKQQGHFRS